MEMKRKLYMAFFLVIWLGLAACVLSPGDGGDGGKQESASGGAEKSSSASAEEEARKERLHEAAQMRAALAESELKDYTIQYIKDLLAEVYPGMDLSDMKVTISKDNPTQEEVATLGGDEEKAFALMRDADFTISVMKADGTSCIPYEQRKDFLNALGEKGFTAHLELGFYEYEYVVAGEVHVEPKPGY